MRWGTKLGALSATGTCGSWSSWEVAGQPWTLPATERGTASKL